MFLIDRMDKQRMEARAATPMVSLKLNDEFDLAVQLDLKPRRSPVWQVLANACINCR